MKIRLFQELLALNEAFGRVINGLSGHHARQTIARCPWQSRELVRSCIRG